MNTIKIEFIGADNWGRDCFKNVENGNIYKMVDGVLHTSSNDGEPECPLRKDLIIEFTRKDEEARYRCLIKRELRKKGLPFKNEDKTKDLLDTLDKIVYKPINQILRVALSTYKGHIVIENEKGKSLIIDKANFPYFFERVKE